MKNFLFFYFFVLPSSAFAYVDPGSSLAFIQGLIAVIGALIFAIKNPLTMLKKLIRKILGKKDA